MANWTYVSKSGRTMLTEEGKAKLFSEIKKGVPNNIIASELGLNETVVSYHKIRYEQKRANEIDGMAKSIREAEDRAKEERDRPEDRPHLTIGYNALTVIGGTFVYEIDMPNKVIQMKKNDEVVGTIKFDEVAGLCSDLVILARNLEKVKLGIDSWF